jgi:HEPN domain-containing protein
MNEQVKWWIESSRRDEEMARILMEKSYYEGAAFHVQQSAVKLLKAVQISKEIASNQLMCVKIIEAMVTANLPADNIANFGRKLDLFYTDSRYPINGPPHRCFDEVMIVELFVSLERIQSFCGKYLIE